MGRGRRMTSLGNEGGSEGWWIKKDDGRKRRCTGRLMMGGLRRGKKGR